MHICMLKNRKETWFDEVFNDCNLFFTLYPPPPTPKSKTYEQRQPEQADNFDYQRGKQILSQIPDKT